MTWCAARSAICSSVAPMKRKPDAYSNCFDSSASQSPALKMLGRSAYEDRHKLKTMRVIPIHTQGGPILAHEADFNQPRQPGRHESIPEERMHHRAQHQLLRMRAHCVPGQKDDDAGYDVSLWPSVSCPAQPHPHETRAPPDNTHTRVLQVIVSPRTTPSVLGECVYASPYCNHRAIVEFLRASMSPDPVLADK